MKLLKDNHADGALAGGIALVVGTIIAIAIGILIYFKLSSSLFYSWMGVGTGAHDSLNTSVLPVYSAINSSANSVWTLMPIICIVLIAGLILAIVMGFGRNPA